MSFKLYELGHNERMVVVALDDLFSFAAKIDMLSIEHLKMLKEEIAKESFNQTNDEIGKRYRIFFKSAAQLLESMIAENLEGNHDF